MFGCLVDNAGSSSDPFTIFEANATRVGPAIAAREDGSGDVTAEELGAGSLEADQRSFGGSTFASGTTETVLRSIRSIRLGSIRAAMGGGFSVRPTVHETLL